MNNIGFQFQDLPTTSSKLTSCFWPKKTVKNFGIQSYQLDRCFPCGIFLLLTPLCVARMSGFPSGLNSGWAKKTVLSELSFYTGSVYLSGTMKCHSWMTIDSETLSRSVKKLNHQWHVFSEILKKNKFKWIFKIAEHPNKSNIQGSHGA